MYSKRPHIIIGFHGCDESVRDKILTHQTPMYKSEKDHDWLGHGMYFWENDLNRALEWAKTYQKEGKITNPSVLGAIIDLGFCLDFLESKYLSFLEPAYKQLELALKAINKTLPANKPTKESKDFLFRPLDCAVIESLHKNRANMKEPSFDTVRGVFWEGKEPYPNAGFKGQNHIQICVRNPNSIKGYFIPREEDDEWSIP